ncbi:hypothetical protein K3495_g1499 [Podosphaera aphanis]|nr:hypothetical protein K3495_g1499 [Podosphaera aphanis]
MILFGFFILVATIFYLAYNYPVLDRLKLLVKAQPATPKQRPSSAGNGHKKILHGNHAEELKKMMPEKDADDAKLKSDRMKMPPPPPSLVFRTLASDINTNSVPPSLADTDTPMRPEKKNPLPQFRQSRISSISSPDMNLRAGGLTSSGQLSTSNKTSQLPDLKLPRLDSLPLSSTPDRASTSGRAYKKVLLAPGHSPLDWARLMSSSTQIPGLPPGAPYLRITPSTLKEYTGRKGKDAWTILSGKVYNITPYLPFHPGGEPELLRCAGRDGTKLFAEVHPWVNWEGMLAKCLIGVAVEEGEMYTRSKLNELD